MYISEKNCKSVKKIDWLRGRQEKQLRDVTGTENRAFYASLCESSLQTAKQCPAMSSQSNG